MQKSQELYKKEIYAPERAVRAGGHFRGKVSTFLNPPSLTGGYYLHKVVKKYGKTRKHDSDRLVFYDE